MIARIIFIGLLALGVSMSFMGAMTPIANQTYSPRDVNRPFTLNTSSEPPYYKTALVRWSKFRAGGN